MKFDKSELIKFFDNKTILDAIDCLHNGKVGELNISGNNKNVRILSTVHDDGSDNDVNISIGSDNLHGTCTCSDCSKDHYCKHIAASLFKYFDIHDEESMNMDSDEYSKDFLNSHSEENERPKLENKISLKIAIRFKKYGRFPEFKVYIGTDKMYSVDNIHTLAENVITGSIGSYGDSPVFDHKLNNFTEEAQCILKVILNCFSESKYYAQFDDDIYDDDSWIPLEAENFEYIFNAFSGQSVSSESGGHSYKFLNKNPIIQVNLSNDGSGVYMSRDKEISFFGNVFHTYAVDKYMIYKCSPEYLSTMNPLINCARDMFFAYKDIPDLKKYLQSFSKEFIRIYDPENILELYIPDECTGCYCLHYDKARGLTLLVKFKYGENRIVFPISKSIDYFMNNINRNYKLEKAILKPAEEFFEGKYKNGVYYISKESDAIEFLCTHLKDLRDAGEVCMSDSLVRKKVSSKSKPYVHVSISNGAFSNLRIFAADVSYKELEDIYNSYVENKKYHILDDGRYIQFDDESEYGKIAVFNHELKSKIKDFDDGEIEVPIQASLYLDDLTQNIDGVTIRKSDEFSKFVKDFKSFADNDYELPKEFHGELRSYQLDGFKWMKTLERRRFGGILADEMGLGKTIQAIAYLTTVRREKVKYPNIIICPASLVINWADELEKFAPDLKVLCINGSADERAAQLTGDDSDIDVYITSYSLIRCDYDSLYKSKYFYTCILDEGQYIKNQYTKTSDIVKNIGDQSVQRFILSGTPIENHLSELWNLFDFLMHGYLLSNNKEFVKRYEKPIVIDRDPEAQKKLNMMVTPFILKRKKDEVLKDLPPKILHNQKIMLSEEERKIYLAETHNAYDIASKTKDRIQILALITKLREICCDPSLRFQNYEGPESKLETCIDLCKTQVSNGHKILLFSSFTSMLDIIKKRLDDNKISNCMLTGDTPSKDRVALAGNFNVDDTSVFLISLRAGGVGLNLTGADVVIHYDYWWNKAVQDQATDRAHRIGQDNTVNVYKIIAKDTIEEKILKLQDDKASLADAITDDIYDPNSYTVDELLSLFK